MLLRLVNGTLRQRMERGESLEKAIEYADKALTRRGLSAFDPTNPGERADAVRATLDVSIDLLSAAQQAQFARLAVFPEDADIPFGTLEKLWGLDDFDTEEVITALNNASLLLNFALDARVIRLHDVVRHYLIGMHRADLPAWQAAFVDALVTKAPRAEGEGFGVRADNEYEWRHIAYHLMEAGRAETLRGLLLDYRFLQAKLDATNVNALIADCGYLADDEAIRLIQSALRMSAHVLTEDKAQWGSQLVGRLMTWRRDVPDIHALTEVIMGNVQGIYPAFPDNDYEVLNQADGPLLRTLSGHTMWVNHVALTADGQTAVSASGDKTLRVWDVATGETRHVLSGHTGSVTSVKLSGEYAVSASSDNMLIVWNWQTGEHLRTLQGHTESVGDVALSGEYAVSASSDNMLIVWNWVKNGRPINTQWHTDRIRYIEVTSELIISSSNDGNLIVWDIITGKKKHVLRGHTGRVRGVIANLEGRLAISFASDNQFIVWDLKSGKLFRTYNDIRAVSRDFRREAVDFLKVDLNPEYNKEHTVAGFGLNLVKFVGQKLAFFKDDNPKAFSALYLDFPIQCARWLLNDELIVIGDTAGRVLFLRYRAGNT